MRGAEYIRGYKNTFFSFLLYEVVKQKSESALEGDQYLSAERTAVPADEPAVLSRDPVT